VPPGAGRLAGFSSNFSAGADPQTTPEEEYGLASAAGANAQRIDVHWSFMEPDPPVNGVRSYRGAGPEHGYLDNLDARYQAMRARGLKPILILSSAPRWAQQQQSVFSGPGCDDGRDCWRGVEPASERLSDWSQFAAFIAARYDDAAFEIWNEPNLRAFYRPAPDPARYQRLFRWAYNAIKATDPGAEVLTGGISAVEVNGPNSISQRDFITGLYRQGIKAASDFRLAVHLYPHDLDLGPGSLYARQWDAILDSMRAHGDGGRQIWVTETGITTSPEWSQGSEVHTYGHIATPEDQADVMRRLYNRLMSMPDADVHAVLFHTLIDRAGPTGYPSSSPEHGYGFTRDKPWLAPKPAFCWMMGQSPAGAPARSFAGC
jgi:hypothetical protein